MNNAIHTYVGMSNWKQWFSYLLIIFVSLVIVGCPLPSVINSPPSIGEQLFNASEGISAGMVISRVIASDPESSSLIYRITANSPPGQAGLFSINPRTGDLMLAQGRSLDRETVDSHIITVQVSDQAGETESALITIIVTDVNEAPSFNLLESTIAVNDNIPSGTVIGRMIASDPEEGELIFSISANSPASGTGLFSINPTNGNLMLAEGQTLNSNTASHTITIQVRDEAEQTASENITIMVADLNEPPRFGSAIYAFAQPESITDTHAIGSVSARDPNGDTLSYSVLAPHNSLFEFADPSMGVLSLVSGQSLDYETMPLHAITVQVTARGQSTTASVLITVSNVNEPPTAPMVLGGVRSLSAASSIDPSDIIGIITSQDPEGDRFIYEIAMNSSDFFEIDPVWGVLSLAEGEMLGATPSSHTITVRVNDFINAPVSAEFTITVIGSGNQAPSFSSASYTFTQAENIADTDAIGTVSASDPDNDALSYFVVPPHNNLFEFADPSMGVLSLVHGESLDYETAPSHTITVQVSSSGHSARATVTVQVTNVTEIIPSITRSGIVRENSTITLSGSGSITEGATGIYSWTLISPLEAPAGLRILNPSSVTTQVMLPYLSEVGMNIDLEFQLAVSVGGNSETEAHTINLRSMADADGDGLIEIRNKTMLHNMRYSLNGAEYKTSETDVGVALGCPSTGCIGYELIRDLDFDSDGDGGTWTENSANTYSLDSGDDNDTYFNVENGGWLPIGRSATPFTATFEGNGHSIRNLAVNVPSRRSGSGLFGVSADSHIRNVHLERSLIHGAAYIGGFIGYAENVRIVGTTIDSSSIITAGSNLGIGISAQIGGLVGQAEGITIIESVSNATVSGNRDVGGLVGRADNATITASSSNATVQRTLNGGGFRIGGLIGRGGNVTITASFAHATVHGEEQLGGLVGIIVGESNITASYSRSTITGSSGDIVGYYFGNLNITASYSNNTLQGRSNDRELFRATRGSSSRVTTTQSYGFGNGTVKGSTPPEGVTMLSQLTATNAGNMWDNTASGTAGAWNFSQRVDGGPSLRYADYDGPSGNRFYCAGSSAPADTSIQIPNCGQPLANQF